jgi:hypothetical protein
MNVLHDGKINIKQKNKKYHIVSTVSISSKIKLQKYRQNRYVHLTRIYMTIHSPGLVEALQEKVTGLN